MTGFLEIVRLEWRRIIRSHSLWLLLAACAAWIFALPFILKSDGTAEGARTIFLQCALGGGFAISAVSLSAAGALSLSREREEHRLALARVRPVSRFALAAGRIAALTFAGAIALGLCAAIVALRHGGDGRTCDHVFDPVMESPAAEAEKMYERYLSLLPKLDEPDCNPELADVLTAMTNAPKATVLRMFMQRARDRYETVATNATTSWKFALPPSLAGRPLAVRMRFSSDFNLRDEVRGVFTFGDFSGAVSNITKSVIRIPLSYDAPLASREARGSYDAPLARREFRASSFVPRVSEEVGKAGNAESSSSSAQPSTLNTQPSTLNTQPSTLNPQLHFANTGRNSLMLRPRRDIKLLVAADSFYANLIRAYIQLVSMLAAICAFAVFLGSWLGRTVAVFSCFVMLFVGTVASDVIVSYPDQLESDCVDRISLAITRTVEFAARPLSSLSPISALAADECIEPRQTGLVVALDGLTIPLLFSLLSAFALRKVGT